MYSLEYMKTNGKTITIQTESFDDIDEMVHALLVEIRMERLIYFNVEVIHGNTRKD